jgi:hypothetical protein
MEWFAQTYDVACFEDLGLSVQVFQTVFAIAHETPVHYSYHLGIFLVYSLSVPMQN